MEQQAQDQEDLRLYLLGLLPQERLPPLEERLLTDSAFYEELLIAEEDLSDEYLAGGLTERDRATFEARFASTADGAREVRFARALRAYVASNAPAADGAPAESPAKPGPSREAGTTAGGRGFFARLRTLGPAPALSLVAATLLLVCGVSWLAVRSLRPSGPRAVLSVLLTPGAGTRADGDVQQVVVPAGTDELRLQLRLTEDGFQSYRVTLHGDDGAAALTAERLKPEKAADGQPIVVVSVPARDAPPGDYSLRLSGVAASGAVESADSYRFKLITR